MSNVSGGWWRRNRWGVLLLVPALALAVGVELDDAYHLYWQGQPRQPVPLTAGGWAEFGGGRMRLVELAPATVTDDEGRPFPLPREVTVWRARIAFDVPKPDTLGGCDIALEDATRRTFDQRPDELVTADIPIPSCTPELDSPARSATGPVTFETVAHFVLPAGAKAVAVRVTRLTAMPRYARLTLSTGD